MKCMKCKKDFEEKDIQESHDIPKYMGGCDLDGRHWLCKRCHGIYEWKIIKLIWDSHDETTKESLRDIIRTFRNKYFGEENETKS